VLFRSRKVAILYRRTRSEMPALREEIEEAEREGIELHDLVVPKRVIARSGKVGGLECLRARPGEFDKSGRRRPVPIEGSDFILDADVVIAAIGQAVDATGLDGEGGLGVDERGTIAADVKTCATGMDGVFAGGDCVTGPDTVIEAIAAGKRAAEAIDRYLGGDGVLFPRAEVVRRLTHELIEEETPRQPVPCVPVEQRVADFTEVELGYTAGMALAEAARCLRCDVRE